MSDIVITNAKLPTNCFTCDYEKLTGNCPCHIGICSASEYKNSKNPDCPLVEVPTHGDLIERSSVYKVLDDRIAFYKEAGDEYNACNIACIEGDIVVIPTIIEAST